MATRTAYIAGFFDLAGGSRTSAPAYQRHELTGQMTLSPCRFGHHDRLQNDCDQQCSLETVKLRSLKDSAACIVSQWPKATTA